MMVCYTCKVLTKQSMWMFSFVQFKLTVCMKSVKLVIMQLLMLFNYSFSRMVWVLKSAFSQYPCSRDFTVLILINQHQHNIIHKPKTYEMLHLVKQFEFSILHSFIYGILKKWYMSILLLKYNHIVTTGWRKTDIRNVHFF